MGFARTFETLPIALQEDSAYLKDSIQITEIQPGSIQIERGSDINITTKVNGHFDAPVSLYYRVGSRDEVTATAEWQSLPMHRNRIDTGHSAQTSEIISPYQATLENVTRPLQYYISVNEVASGQYQLTISNELIVTQFQYRLNYPAYTQLQPQTLPADIGDIQTLFGTEIVFTGESNKLLQKASLVFEGQVICRWRLKGSSYRKPRRNW